MKCTTKEMNPSRHEISPMLKDYIAEVLFAVTLLRTRDFEALNSLLSRLKQYQSNESIVSQFQSEIIQEDLHNRKKLINRLKDAYQPCTTVSDIAENDLDGVVMCNGILQYQGELIENIVKEWSDVKHLEDHLLI